jgi:hypothetical protein
MLYVVCAKQLKKTQENLSKDNSITGSISQPLLDHIHVLNMYISSSLAFQYANYSIISIIIIKHASQALFHKIYIHMQMPIKWRFFFFFKWSLINMTIFFLIFFSLLFHHLLIIIQFENSLYQTLFLHVHIFIFSLHVYISFHFMMIDYYYYYYYCENIKFHLHTSMWKW